MKENKNKPQPTDNNERMALAKKNYYWMLAGVGIIILGFILMSGGGSKDPSEFNEAIFSFRRITLAPIIVIAGFAVVGYGIMKRFKK